MAKKKGASPGPEIVAAVEPKAPEGPTVLVGEAHAYTEQVVDQPYRLRDPIVYVGGASYAHVADAIDGRWIYSDRHLAK